MQNKDNSTWAFQLNLSFFSMLQKQDISSITVLMDIHIFSFNQQGKMVSCSSELYFKVCLAATRKDKARLEVQGDPGGQKRKAASSRKLVFCNSSFLSRENTHCILSKFETCLLDWKGYPFCFEEINIIINNLLNGVLNSLPILAPYCYAMSPSFLWVPLLLCSI